MLTPAAAKPPERTARRRRPLPPGGPSVVRRAITLLLHHPDAASDIEPDRLSMSERPGVALLTRLIETVRSEPKITTAGLLERWRHDDEGRHLGKLAAVEMPEADDFDPAAEFRHCVTRLEAEGRRAKIDLLFKKQRVGPLTDEEKAELRGLM
jgi:DNA primase